MLVNRARGNTALENQRDWDALRWIARFRFVDAHVLSLHLGVSKQQASARARRLEAEGLVARSGTRGGTATWLISVTRRGMRALGVPPRRQARTDIQRDHELALAWLVTRLEAGADAPTVKTERESRSAEAATGVRHSADVYEPNRRKAKRWPDLVVEHADGRRVVLEFERTLKGTSRLARIVEGYRAARWFNEVWLFCADATIGRAAAEAARRDTNPLPGFPDALVDPDEPTISLAPWPGLEPAAKHAVQRALDQAPSPARHQGRLHGR
jgi:hypothetical protein